MRIHAEINLASFQFWAGAKDNSNLLTYEELELLDNILTDIYPDGIEESTLNDWFWFEFEDVCSLLGYTYDIQEGKIIR